MIFRALLFVAVSIAMLAQTGSVAYSKEGIMILPKDYREWTFLSAGLNMVYGENGGSAANPRFENVFVNPAAYRQFVKSGKWPDKTTLILEIRASDSRVSINKDGRVQTNVVAIEAHVKDAAKGGWAFYGFDASGQNGKSFPKSADCYSCHEKNGSVDTTFVQFYPTLREVAKAKGTYRDSE